MAQEVASIRVWQIEQMYAISRNPRLPKGFRASKNDEKGQSWLFEILKFLMLHGFFSPAAAPAAAEGKKSKKKKVAKAPIHDPEFQAKVAIESLKGEASVEKLSRDRPSRHATDGFAG